ncbi:MAG: NUDIX domain-containing protein [Candidatus Rifleibacteriota bacterium]
MPDENILCLKRTEIPEEWLQNRVSLKLSRSDFLFATKSLKAEFQPRNSVESNPDFKQLIPYIMLLDQNDRLAFYLRGGNEKRLHGCYSVGIGGHIRDDDFSDGIFSWEELGEKALQRELQEELPGFAPPASPEFLGLVNEEITRVGHSHLGLVYLFRYIDSENLIVGEELQLLQWMEPQKLFRESGRSFEIWSELAFELIEGLLLKV